jgi:hypothetical protein
VLTPIVSVTVSLARTFVCAMDTSNINAASVIDATRNRYRALSGLASRLKEDRTDDATRITRLAESVDEAQVALRRVRFLSVDCSSLV